MKNNKRNLIVVPARGGSKGIHLKNIYPICGKPLLEYTLDVIFEAELQFESDIVVSTDSKQIAQVAEKYNLVEIIDRPEEIASDTASTEAALLHALTYMEVNYNKYYENIITLQPTSPLRKANTLKNFINKFYENEDKHDAQISLTESRADYWIKNVNGNFERLYKTASRRRQDRNPIYIENSALYITKVASLLSTKSILGISPTGFIIDEIEAIDINSMNDIKLAESYMIL